MRLNHTCQYFHSLRGLAFLVIIFSMAWQLSPSPSFAQVQTLRTEPLEIITKRGSYKFSVEIADEPEEHSIGLMNRAEMAKQSGMLFDFGKPRVINMWMKNTLISLDMIFTDQSGKVVSIRLGAVPHSLDIITSGEPASHVLEINAGIAKFIGLAPGDKLVHPMFSD